MKWIKDKPKKDMSKWHKWFAWKPVEVQENEDGSKEMAFLEFVERKGGWVIPPMHLCHPYWVWEYRKRLDYVRSEDKVLDNLSTETTVISGEAPVSTWHGSFINIPSLDEEIEPSVYDTISKEPTFCKKCGIDSLCECPEGEEDRITVREWRKECGCEYTPLCDCQYCSPELWTSDVTPPVNPDWLDYSKELTPRERDKHPIDVAWEVKEAKRNKTIE